MKRTDTAGYRRGGGVAPFVGAWIETVKYRVAHAVNPVAPFAGARIEIAG